jgi:hypothetical protein
LALAARELAARELDAALAHQRPIASRQLGDELLRMGQPRRELDLAQRGAALAIGDALREAAVKQYGLRQAGFRTDPGPTSRRVNAALTE